jgi:hypothetical protein
VLTVPGLRHRAGYRRRDDPVLRLAARAVRGRLQPVSDLSWKAF